MFTEAACGLLLPENIMPQSSRPQAASLNNVTANDPRFAYGQIANRSTHINSAPISSETGMAIASAMSTL